METQEKKIGKRDNTYVVTPLPGRAGIRRCFKILKVLKPAFGGKGEESSDRLTDAVSEILNLLSEDQVIELCTQFGEHTLVRRADGAELHLGDDRMFDAHFAANYGEMLKWLAFCFEVNFASFLDGTELSGSNLLQELMRKAKP